MMVACATCVFWVAGAVPDTGECRANAPDTSVRIIMVGADEEEEIGGRVFPVTSALDGCGVGQTSGRRGR